MSTTSRKFTRTEFVDWIHSWYQQATSLDGAKAVLMRRRPEKRVHEEALPLYHYVHHYFPDDVLIELPGDHDYDSADARIYASGGALIECVQITIPVEEGIHLARRAIVTTGRDIADVFSPSITPLEYARTVDEVIAKKMTNFAYEANTSLLVALSDDMVLEDQARFEDIINHMSALPASHRFIRVVVVDYSGKFHKELK